jgi:hypothetical protein
MSDDWHTKHLESRGYADSGGGHDRSLAPAFFLGIGLALVVAYLFGAFDGFTLQSRNDAYWSRP